MDGVIVVFITDHYELTKLSNVDHILSDYFDETYPGNSNNRYPDCLSNSNLDYLGDSYPEFRLTYTRIILITKARITRMNRKVVHSDYLHYVC